MTPEEINKKAYEKYPILTRGHGIDLNYGKREMYIEFLQEISALPTIKGWVARDGDGTLYLYIRPPYRDKNYDWWHPIAGRDKLAIDISLFPELRYEDEPIEVELPIIRK